MDKNDRILIVLGDYTIRTDSTCFTVERPRKGLNEKTGKDKKGSAPIGYFGRFSQAVSCIANQVVLDGTDTKVIIDKLLDIEKEIKSWNCDPVYVLGKIKGGK